MLNFENCDKILFQGVGQYDIPQIEPTNIYPEGEFISCNAILSDKTPGDKIAHCFVDDYQFIRYWNWPDKYIPIIQRLKAICAPDFSTYRDMPLAMQIYNHYRKHWLAAYWQMQGITVYPTISWSDEKSYDWCFDGEPVGGIAAVSSVGCAKDKEAKKYFLKGYEQMMKRLDPSYVIFYGKVFEECDWNVIRVEAFAKQFDRRAKAAEERRNPWKQLSLI